MEIHWGRLFIGIRSCHCSVISSLTAVITLSIYRFLSCLHRCLQPKFTLNCSPHDVMFYCSQQALGRLMPGKNPANLRQTMLHNHFMHS
ncbi:hypothetical protein D3C76_295780 [compost metagenome]